MSQKIRSAKGEMVDFDLLKIKESIASGPKPISVEAREEFVDKKLRRRLKKVVKKIEKAEPEQTNVDVDSKAIDN